MDFILVGLYRDFIGTFCGFVFAICICVLFLENGIEQCGGFDGFLLGGSWSLASR